jgi:hypothetical protein
MVVPVVPARMEKTAVLALGHLARAPRGTARIYFTVRARRGVARCPQPVAAVLVADLAALHSLARPTRARLRLSEPTPPSSSHLGSPVPSPYSAVHARRPTPPSSSHLSPVSRAHRCLPHTRPSSRLGTNSTLRAKTTPGRRGRAVDRNASRPSAGPRAGRIARPTDKYPLEGGPGLAPVSHYSPNLWIWDYTCISCGCAGSAPGGQIHNIASAKACAAGPMQSVI